jgi:hypothetical protein
MALADLVAAREALEVELATESADADPNEIADGVAWSDHRSALIKQIGELNKLIQQAQGAVELQSQALG